MSSRTIVFLYSQFQNTELAQKILYLLDEYDLGFTSIQVDSPESRELITGKIDETPAFIVKTGNIRKEYYASRAYDFIMAVIEKYPDRKKYQEEEEFAEEEIAEEEIAEVVIEPPPQPPAVDEENDKFSSVKNMPKDIPKNKKPKAKKTKVKTTSVNDENILDKWEDELGTNHQIESSEIDDENDYFPSSEEDNDVEEIDDGISVIYDEDDKEDMTPAVPNRQTSIAMKMAADMAEERKGMMQTQFPRT